MNNINNRHASWSLSQAWNAALDIPRERELVERDYIWASELGGSRYDRYMRMHGRPPITPPGQRARRKFSSGDMTEWIVKQVLVRSGIFLSAQDHIVNEEGAMKVTGRCDFIAGGQIKDIDVSDLPESLQVIAGNTVNILREQYLNGLDTQILEIKSCSGMMFNRYEIAPSPSHALQAFHYAHTLDIPAHLVYVSRDDLRLCEYVILPNSERYKKLYFEDIESMKLAYDLPLRQTAKQLREPLLLFENGKFSKNWKVEYSNYLTDYGFERPDEYADKAKVSTRLNNVLKRIREGKELTKVNKEALDIGIEFWPEVRKIVGKELSKADEVMPLASDPSDLMERVKK